jgi:hypothetical protein
LEKKTSKREDREEKKEKVLVLESLRLAVDWLILERKVMSNKQYR